MKTLTAIGLAIVTACIIGMHSPAAAGHAHRISPAESGNASLCEIGSRAAMALPDGARVTVVDPSHRFLCQVTRP